METKKKTAIAKPAFGMKLTNPNRVIIGRLNTTLDGVYWMFSVRQGNSKVTTELSLSFECMEVMRVITAKLLAKPESTHA